MLSQERGRDVNQGAKDLFSLVATQGVTTACYLLCGVNASLLNEYVLKFAQQLNCEKVGVGCGVCVSCVEIAQKIFPELYFYQAGEGVESLRQRIAEIKKVTLPGLNKIVIITQSSQLTTIEANLLLKIVEEPPTHTFFFFLSRSRQILPTLLSRLIVVSLTPPLGESVALSSKVFQQLNSELYSLEKSEIIERKSPFSQLFPLLESEEQNLQWRYDVSVALEDLISQWSQFTGFERVTFLLQLEKSLKRDRKRLQQLLEMMLIKLSLHPNLDKMIEVKESLTNYLSIKVILWEFFENLLLIRG